MRDAAGTAASKKECCPLRALAHAAQFRSSTIRYYVRTVRDFAAHFHKPPDQLGAQHLRQFQLYLLRDRKLATGTVENRITSLHFFFKKLLKRYYPELYDMLLARVPKK